MHVVNTKQAFSFIWQMVRSFPSGLIALFLTSVVWAIDLAATPYLMKFILDGVTAVPMGQAIFTYLAVPIIFYFLLKLLRESMFRVNDYFFRIRMIPRLRQKIANTIFAHLLRHSHHYYQSNFAGSLSNKINNLTDSIPEIMEIAIERFFSHFLGLLVATYTLWLVNIKFALAMGIWALLLILVSLFWARDLERLSHQCSEISSTITGKMVDVLSNMLSIKLFARESKEKALLEDTFEEAVQEEQKLQWTFFYIWLFYGYSFVVMQAICLYFLIQGRQHGIISIGDFALVLTLNSAVVDYLWDVAKDFSHFSRLVGRITQALNITTVPIEIQDRPQAQTLIVQKGQIDFEKVGFHYKGSEPLFQDLSVVIKPGQKVGLVGYSGSGKTTFVHLMLRLYEVTSGRILIDGQDIREVTQQSLHQEIGMIPQDPSLFHRTLMDNIRYGHSEATEEEVTEAAKRAHAHNFITTLSTSYQSLVGERGVKLSGGQRQRIAVARAVLKNAPILILDEATSQLDSVTESYIQESLWELMQGKTTLVVAHRLSTLLQMDRILVFDRGKIVEEGTHDELLNREGLYKVLWNAQIGGFLLEQRAA